MRSEVFHSADEEGRVDYTIDIDVSEDHPISSFSIKAAFGQKLFGPCS